MKKFLNILAILIISITCLFVAGCDDRYGNLTITASFSYSSNESTTLDDGTIRVRQTGGSFDILPNGSYVFYKSPNKISESKLLVAFKNTPNDFIYGATIDVTTNIMSLKNSAVEYVDGGVIYTMVISDVGSGDLIVTSNEGDKKDTLRVEVVEVEEKINFEDNNLALTRTIGNFIDFSTQINLKYKGANLINYSFGEGTQEDFREYTPQELLLHGFSYEDISQVLTLRGQTDLDSILVKATYFDPLGENKYAYTTIKIVENIEDDLKIFKGTTKEDIKEENDITNSNFNLIANIEGKNFVDIILRVTTNGEEVVFDVAKDDLFPFESLIVQPNYSRKNIFYLDENGVEVSSYSEAKRAIGFYRLVVNKITTNENYANYIYPLNFLANYKNYIVKDYPVKSLVNFKNYNVIRQFSVNNTRLKSMSIDKSSLVNEKERIYENAYTGEVLLNTDTDILGQSFFVEISDPVSILEENSHFTLELLSSDMAEILNPTDYFTFSYNRGSDLNQTLPNDTVLTTQFSKDTTFYIKPSNTIEYYERYGFSYYLILRSSYPTDATNGQVICAVELKIVEGLKEIQSFDLNYKDDEEEKNSTILFSNLTGSRIYGEEDVKLNIESARDIVISLSCLPISSKLDTLKIVSSDPSIAEVVRLSSLNQFSLNLKKTGESEIFITSSNLSVSYVIRLVIYEPVTNFIFSLRQHGYEAGVLKETNSNDGSTTSVIVKTLTKLNFNLIPLPLRDIDYETNVKIFKILDEEILIGEYLSNENSSTIEDGGFFTFNAVDMSFSFTSDSGADYTYKIVVTLKNLNGTELNKEVLLSAFVPNEAGELKINKTDIYSSKNLYYKDKIEEKDEYIDVPQDDSTFGVNLVISGERTPTYTFEKNGTLDIYVNDIIEKSYNLVNGFLEEKNSYSNYLTLLSTSTIQNNFYFRLNENYPNLDGKIRLEAKINEEGHLFIRSTVLNIKKVNTISSLYTATSEEIQIRQGIDLEKTFDVEISNEDAYNKNLVYKVLTIINKGGKRLVVEREDEKLSLKVNDLSSLQKRFVVSADRTFKGEGIIVVLPQDRLNTKENYDIFYNPQYVEVKITKEEFEEGMFYLMYNGNYLLATSYSSSSTYYVKTFDTTKIVSLCDFSLCINVAVTNGDDVPYRVTNYMEFMEIGLTSDSVSKNYVLTRDIVFSSSNFTPIANYYLTELDEESFEENTYYTLEDGKYVLANTYDEEKTYYGYGFNGHLSGKYSFYNASLGREEERLYGIYGIYYSGKIEGDYIGLFAKIGKEGVVEDLTINYNFLRVDFGDSIFGGVAGENKGTISNITLTYDNFMANAASSLTLGGVVGENSGVILKKDLSNTISGQISITTNENSSKVYVGGVAGVNNGEIIGSFDSKKEVEITFNSVGYDSDISISVSGASSSSIDSAVGGVIGVNIGSLSDFAFSGRVLAPNLDYVGGLIGKILYSEKYNIENETYNLKNSFSTSYVEGRNYVGGVIGGASDGSFDSTQIIRIDSSSFENYNTSGVMRRTFIKGESYVGGFIGLANYVSFTRCYAVSYYDCFGIEGDNKGAQYNYDVVGNERVGGFAGRIRQSYLLICAVVLNVYAKTGNLGIFTPLSDNIKSFQDVFSIGCIYSQGSTQGGMGITNGTRTYSVCYNARRESYEYTLNGSTVSSFDNISINYEGEDFKWARDTSEADDKINKGLPYLVLKESGKETPLFASTPITFSVTVKESDFVTFLKADDNSLILFFAYDNLGQYLSQDVSKLNTLNLFDLLDLNVQSLTYKTSRFNVSSSNSSVLSISSKGQITIVGTGSTTITISSKLNSDYKKTIDIVVVFGVSDVELFENPSLSNTLENKQEELVKNHPQTLYMKTSFEKEGYTFQSSNDVGIRFYVESEDAQKIVEENYTINDYLTIGSNSIWAKEGDFYYIDVDSFMFLNILPKMAFSTPLTLYYVPYIKETFPSGIKYLFLWDIKEKSFKITVTNGATEVVFENNENPYVEINQLQSLAIKVIVFTDYEGDDIATNLGTLKEEDRNFGYTEGMLARNYTNGKLTSISKTYTFYYEDKTNVIDETKFYDIFFAAASNSGENYRKHLYLTISGIDGVNQIFADVYSDLERDFPQNKSSSNNLYNATTGLLSVEIYPYFAKYDRLRLSSYTDSGYPIILGQVYYNIAGTGERFSYYEGAGSILGNDQSLLIEKGSGQDTYLVNVDGKYSYSRSYFFSLFIASAVPNGSRYSITIEVLDVNGKVMTTKTINLISVAKSTLSMSFDEKLKGDSANGYYYLPLNTENRLDISSSLEDAQFAFSVESSDYDLNENQKTTLTPVCREGSYYVKVLDYEGGMDFDTSIIGKTITITASLKNSEIESSTSITFVVTLFTVTNIMVDGLDNSYLTLENSTTSPLRTKIDIYYDESLTELSSNWYTEWYEENGADNSNSLYQNIVNSGYKVEEFFSGYITTLQEEIAKANYSKDNISNKISGVFMYVDETGTIEPLHAGKIYNNGFMVEDYNDFIAVSGLSTEISSSLRLNVKLSYSHKNSSSGTADSKGLANVKDYSFEASSYEGSKTFTQSFTLVFVDRIELLNPEPVSSVEEFLNMEEGKDYRLVCDIVLGEGDGYSPIEAKMKSFDGNNYKIYITKFKFEDLSNSSINLGLFSEVSENTILYNTTVFYTSGTYLTYKEGNLENPIITPRQTACEISVLSASSFNFGGIAVRNRGAITNGLVMGNVKINIASNGNDWGGIYTTANVLNGGLVSINLETGFITNSNVDEFTFTCYGETGGFVGENNGKIVACAFKNSSITNMSSDSVGGFANRNSGNIYESFSEGKRGEFDRDIRNTGTTIGSFGGFIGGFIFSNDGEINDCYSNIWISSSSSLAGFVYRESGSSTISRCYSISYKSSSNNTTTAFPFAGPSNSELNKIIINGFLNNCYFLGGDQWSDANFYRDEETDDPSLTPENKKATSLTFDNFATHTSFSNYDLSLVYNTEKYANGEEYNYIDGYTWVIIEGKPVIVSTLTKTISQQDYLGKEKVYRLQYVYFDLNDYLGENDETTLTRVVTTQNEITREDYYSLTTVAEDSLVYSVTTNSTDNTVIYNFKGKENREDLVVRCKKDLNSENKNELILISAEYGNSEKIILDVRESEEQDRISSDNNYRANDTIVVERSEDKSQITKITYKELDYARYYYEASEEKISDIVGSRTNPEILYDYDSFSFALTKNSNHLRFYRVIKDIDLNYTFVATSHATFKGVLQGNFMRIQNLSVAYYNNVVDSTILNPTSFGLFAEIKNVEGEGDTVISNISIEVDQVLSNAHNFVGVLAGKIEADDRLGGQKIFINNVNILSSGLNPSHVQGKNAVGGLGGLVTGNVIIKDITCDVRVNATCDNSRDLPNSMLYRKDLDDLSNISYAGGVVGIFDVNQVVDPATLKNFNASNILVNANNIYLGNIVGTAFGLIGENSVVNYTNVLVNYSSDVFIKSSGYAGGIVGENRGLLIASSIKYLNEEKNKTSIAHTEYVENDFFFSSGQTAKNIAIGGIAGLNNGGIIYNTISTINTRNKMSEIAGGVVGRFVEGALINVINMGSVISRKISGGLIGTLNDREILIESGGYNENALVQFDPNKFSSLVDISTTKNKKVIIANCVAGTNWLTDDFAYIEQRNERNDTTYGAVGGFIGYCALSIESTTSKLQDRLNELVLFNSPSFYSNTIYQNQYSIIPSGYLFATYLGSSFDIVQGKDIDPALLLGEDGNQNVFSYSTSEFFYESTSPNKWYTMRYNEINPTFVDDNGNRGRDRFDTIIDIEPMEMRHNDHFYTKINEEDFSGVTFTGLDFTWFKNMFGQVYYKNEGNEYVLVASDSDFNDLKEKGNLELYYISSQEIDEIAYSTTFEEETNDIYLFGNLEGINKVNGNTFEDLQNIKDQTIFYINGLYIQVDPQTLEVLDEAEDFTQNSYSYKNLNQKMIDGGTIQSMDFEVEGFEDGGTERFRVTSVTLHYLYDNLSSLEDNNFTRYTSLSKSTTDRLDVTRYDLRVSSRKVIFSRFDNGYWNFGPNFFARDYNSCDLYPENKELAENYVWTAFRNKNIKVVKEIYSAEDLAALAYSVNVDSADNDPNNYENEAEIVLKADIDMSGKYWEPIGISEDRYFAGSFDGNGHTIKYISVNENSNNGNLLEYAGLFGVTKGATIKNLTILGGEIKGLYAGGVSGFDTGSEISNVVNMNNVIGFIDAGGIVGKGSNTNITNSENSARIEVSQNSTKKEVVSVGGIVGTLIGGSLGNELPNTNRGEIVLNNTKTNYSSLSSFKVTSFIGGIAGKIDSAKVSYDNKNSGAINFLANSHIGHVGGVFGQATNIENLNKLSSSGNILVTYTNIYRKSSYDEEILLEEDARLDIGGVIGYADTDVNMSNCVGDISMSIITSTSCEVGLGGVIGRIHSHSDENALNITQNFYSGNLGSTSTNINTKITAGGVVGMVDFSEFIEGELNTIGKVNVLDSYNSGKLQLGSNSVLYAGGVVGGARFIEGAEERLKISRCINLGSVNISSMQITRNALGAIISTKDGLYLSNPDANIEVETIEDYIPQELGNFYIRDGAFGGGKYFTSFSVMGASNTYEPGEDESTFANSRTSSQLKLDSNYEILETLLSGKEELINLYDFENVWSHEYDTWYPTLRNNNTSSFWEDAQEEIYGTTNIYSVSNAEQLSYIATKLNNGEIESKTAVIRLNNYIDLSNRFWQPIGNEDYPFEGEFDARGFMIKNLTINGLVRPMEYGGLFGIVNNATIKNLTLESPIIKEVKYAGAIAAKVTNSLIIGVCTEMGESENSMVSATTGAGGLVYELKDSYPTFEGEKDKGIYFSYNNIPVKLENVNIEETARAGGLVCRFSRSYISSSYNSVSGKVKSITSSILGGGENNGVVIAGVVEGEEENLKLVNVFNLSSTLSDESSTYECSPLIYEIAKNEEDLPVVSATKNLPTFENLSLNITDGEASDIWTKEYSLNTEEYKDYPTLRSLGKQWKNTSSEALIGFSAEGNYKQNIISYAETLFKVEAEDDDIGNFKNENKIDRSLISFAIDNLEGGSVVIKNIYLITNEGELSWLSTNVNNGNFSTKNCEFILLSDLDLSGGYFTPIGQNLTYSFQGVFNFNGHSIKGLTIDTTNLTYSGLFGYTRGATILNGVLQEEFIKVVNSGVTSETYAGGLVGYQDSTTIMNMTISSNIYAYSTAGTFVGGMSGYVTGNNYTIKNIRTYKPTINKFIDLGQFEDKVVEKEDEEQPIVKKDSINIGGFSGSGVVYAGGLVGYLVGYRTTGDTKYFIEYITNGDLESSGDDFNGALNVAGVSTAPSSNVYAGGIVGYSPVLLSITDAKSTGIVKTYSSKYDIAGGLVGYANDGLIANSMFKGYIEPRISGGKDVSQGATSNIWSYVGGIVGMMEGGQIGSSVCTGLVIKDSSVNENMRAGGILGYAINRDFKNDAPINDGKQTLNIYDISNSGFVSAVGLYNEGTCQNVELIEEKYLDDLSKITEENGFLEENWEGGDLKESKIFVMGAGLTSLMCLEPEEKRLLETSAPGVYPGVYVNNLAELTLSLEGSYPGEVYMGIALSLIENGEIVYKYVEIKIEDELNPITISSLGDLSKTTSIFITLVVK